MAENVFTVHTVSKPLLKGSRHLLCKQQLTQLFAFEVVVHHRIYIIGQIEAVGQLVRLMDQWVQHPWELKDPLNESHVH